MQVLHQLPLLDDPNVLVASETADDAGVYRIDRNRALVQTVDFFTPIVDDPQVYGQIAAANALSDVYAMGGRPLSALNVLGVPPDVLPEAVIRRILRGGASKLKEAGCALIGGHSIRNPEPIYGLAVTGLVSPRRMMTNAGARPGDLLVLTKPLGTGIVTTGIKRGVATASSIREAIRVMRRLNDAGPVLAKEAGVRGATDVTGYGLLGHLRSLCAASGVGAEVFLGGLPAISREVYDLIEKGCIPGGSRDNQEAAAEVTSWGEATRAQRTLMTDAQTSGGLLLCVPPPRLDRVRKILTSRRAPCVAVVGRIVSSKRPMIWVKAR